MESFIADLRRRQEQELIALEQGARDERTRIDGAISILEGSLSSIDEFLVQHRFEDQKVEIHFFKHILPEFHSQKLYYIFLQKMHRQMPEGDISAKKKYYKKQLKKITGFFKEYRVFYEYYRSGEGYLDERYFIRSSTGTTTASETIPIALGLRYCTPGSYTIATILAQKMLEEHIVREIAKLNGKPQFVSAADYGVRWTDTVMALKELVYAFYYRGCFNNGQVEIKQLAEFLGAAFGVTLDNIYRAKQEMYFRSNMSAYLDLLRKRFIEGMEESEERPTKK